MQLVLKQCPERHPTPDHYFDKSIGFQHTTGSSAVLTRRVDTTGVPAYLKEYLFQRVSSRQTRLTASSVVVGGRAYQHF